MNHITKNLILSIMLMLFSISCNYKTSEDTNFSEQQVTYPTSLISSSSSLIKVTEGYNFDTAGSPLYLKGCLYFTNKNFDRPEKSITLRKSSSGEIDILAIDNGGVYFSDSQFITGGQKIQETPGIYYEESGADGLVIDRKGNIYSYNTGLGVQIFSNEGEYLSNIPVPTATNNVTFGGVDNRPLYISAQDGIYSMSRKIGS